MQKMGQTKKQHYVPQFLLKHFSASPKETKPICVFDKAEDKFFTASCRDVGHENKFYESGNSSGGAIEAESLTEFIDTSAAPVISKIATTGKFDITPTDASKLNHFVAMQLVRGPSIRNSMEELRKGIVSKWGSDVCAEGDDKPVSQYTEEDSNFSSIEFLSTVPEFAGILSEKIWFLNSAPADCSFIISDNPVVRHNYLDYGRRGSLGIKQDGIEMFLPISPEYCLSILCPKLAGQVVLSGEMQEEMRLQREGLAVPLEPENVEFVNSLEVIQSERYLYGRTEMDLSIGKEMIAYCQELGDTWSQRSRPR